jgi:hypothetical protein
VGAATLAVTGTVALAQFVVSALTSLSPGQVSGDAAAAALARPAVRPGHWVLRTERSVGCAVSGLRRTWTTADAGNEAWKARGQWWFMDSSSAPLLVSVSTCRDQPAVEVAPGQLGGGDVTVPGPGQTQIQAASERALFSYAGLGSLPRDPDALARHLGRLRLPAGTDLSQGGTRAFFLIYTLAGRAGIGLRLPLRPGSGLTQEIVLAPRTYRLMGYQVLRGQRIVSGTALLRMMLVPRP